MHVLDQIIQNRDSILEVAQKLFKVESIKLYGSVLVRKERPDSNINFLVKFKPRTRSPKMYELLEELECQFGRCVYLVDSRHIPDVFHPSIDR